MGGMFPLQSDQIWNQSINWMAIPVHTTPEKLDYILAGKKPCPLYEQAAKEYLASDEITSLLKSYQSTYQYVEMHSGIKCSREKTILCNPVLVLYEALLIESHKGYAYVSVVNISNSEFVTGLNLNIFQTSWMGWQSVFPRLRSRDVDCLRPRHASWHQIARSFEIWFSIAWHIGPFHDENKRNSVAAKSITMGLFWAW